MKHGHARKGKHTRTYWAWRNMLGRCMRPGNSHYANYGGRGISVCERWQMFSHFLEDMGECPPGKTLDRYDNNKNYNPNNCRWATIMEQAENRRSNRLLTYRGRTQHLSAWAREVGLKRSTLSNRINALKWPTKKALFK